MTFDKFADMHLLFDGMHLREYHPVEVLLFGKYG
jgi:hypothetical protein